MMRHLADFAGNRSERGEQGPREGAAGRPGAAISPLTSACPAPPFPSACKRSGGSPGARARQKPGRHLLECLKNREADVLRFLTDVRIPPTSNQPERGLHPAKIQQKISGRLRSETAARDR